MEECAKRGFITIATGDKYYYKLAANLLMSYKLKTHNPYPFAIIAEEENEYTALFDDVIIVKEVTRSFMDKFLLMKYCPYNETIFFDADILAYSDLNEYWNIFRDATDFSSIGKNCSINEDGAWYDIDGIGRYGDNLKYKVKVHSGICFIRNSEKIKKLYDDCVDIVNNYDKLTIKRFPSSKDEATMGIAMPMNNMYATKELPEYLAVLPCLSYIKVSVLRNTLEYKNNWGTCVNQGGMLVHFGTEQTHEPLYRFEVECFKHLTNNSTDSLLFKIRYKLGTRWISLRLSFFIYKVICMCKRAQKKLSAKMQ